MRELKFRVWNPRTKAWLDDCWMYQSGELDHDTVRSFDLQDCVIQQYTGLKDKNGKDIYEGDIVLSTCSEILNDNFSGEVIFDEGSFLVKVDNTDIRGVSDELEIVGNIFD